MTKRTDNGRCKGRRGQAIFEFVVASLALTLVFMGFLQIASLSWNNVDNLGDARGEVDERVKGVSAFANAVSDQYIMNWNDGNDGLRFTADDTANSPQGFDTLETYSDELTEPFDINNGFDRFGMDNQNQFKGALEIGSIVEGAELRQGTARREVDMELAVRRLIFTTSTKFSLEDKVYMPALDLKEESDDLEVVE